MTEYLRIQEAAKFLNVTMQTLRNWDKDDKLRPYRHPINNYRLYKMADLIRLVRKIKRT